jgi:hypothetical protein
VEVHRGGVIETRKPKAADKKGGAAPDSGDRPTFKFSRVNGSAVYKIESFKESVVTLADLGRDDRFDLDEGNWVEILDDTAILPDTPGPLRKVISVDTFTRRVTLEPLASAGEVGADSSKHPFMRRWDQREGDPARGLRLQDGVAAIELGDWIPLEDGIEIQFQPSPHDTGKVMFRSGDYWLAPARVATGGIIDWPQEKGEPLALPPHGVEHHYAPLAILKVDGGDLTVHGQCRKAFELASTIATKVFGTGS